VSSLRAFQKTGSLKSTLSGGKLLSNIERRVPKASMQISTYGRIAFATISDGGSACFSNPRPFDGLAKSADFHINVFMCRDRLH
jgi:hypothetical protein